MSTYDTYAGHMDPTPRVRRKSGPFGTETLKTVADAVAFCERMGLDLNDARLSHNYVQWDERETTEEVQARVDHWAEMRSQHLARIREMHAEYLERGLYDTPTPPATARREDTPS